MTMSTVEKIALGIVGIALVTTLLLPGRQTAQVINAAGGVFNSAIKTSMGR
jgi:hypothetical protein